MIYINSLEQLKCNSSKEYLGYCPQKGYIYSVQVDVMKYAIIALSTNGDVTTLITHSVPSKGDK